MLDDFVGQVVVVDFRSEFVCLGTLKRYNDDFLELRNCDFHDLRDTDSSRENYVAACVETGIKRNRKKVLLNRREVVAVAALEDIVDG
jgi:hypothetical protein